MANITGSTNPDFITTTANGGNYTLVRGRRSAFTGTGGNATDVADNISGGRGDDTIFGGGGDDSIAGNDGNDTLTGGEGNDTLTGGAANDTFVVDSGIDSITDLSGSDVLRISSGATANATVTAAFTATSDLPGNLVPGIS